jgi:hypothetical protein
MKDSGIFSKKVEIIKNRGNSIPKAIFKPLLSQIWSGYISLLSFHPFHSFDELDGIVKLDDDFSPFS